MMLTSFLFWILTYSALIYGVIELRSLGHKIKDHFLQTQAIEKLRRSVQHLKLLTEMLESGVVPELKDWNRIATFPAPWAKIIFESVSELRSQGAPILPTLSRMQKTLEEQAELILEGKVKSAQAFGQAWVGVFMIPIFSLVLYGMLPELQNFTREFLMLFLFSFFLAAISFIWMISMVEQARFGKIRPQNRSWVISVNVALERIMALMTGGMPADLAYKQTVEELALHDARLAREWKTHVWDPVVTSDFQFSLHSESEKLILNLGNELRRTIQTSLLEGRGCLDRLESMHRTFLVDLKMCIGRELSLLPNRCLKPLFVCVFPAVMILLFGSMAFCFQAQWAP